MLNETFLHLPGIGPSKEQRLWRDGVGNWEDVLDTGRLRWGGTLRGEILERCRDEVAQGCFKTVAELLGQGEHWRALVHRDVDGVRSLRWLALDIETTGLRPPRNRTTVVGICGHATDFKPVALVAEERDWAESLADYLLKSDVLLTFNGR